MSLRVTSVSQSLDRRLKMFGFEVPDLLAIFITLSILNFVFGQTGMKLLFVWLPSVAVAGVLYFGKRGKPDNYLIHWLRYQVKPGVYSAFSPPTKWEEPKRIKKGVTRECRFI
jgi:hypothetical protein